MILTLTKRVLPHTRDDNMQQLVDFSKKWKASPDLMSGFDSPDRPSVNLLFRFILFPITLWDPGDDGLQHYFLIQVFICCCNFTNYKPWLTFFEKMRAFRGQIGPWTFWGHHPLDSSTLFMLLMDNINADCQCMSRNWVLEQLLWGNHCLWSNTNNIQVQRSVSKKTRVFVCLFFPQFISCEKNNVRYLQWI